MGNKEALLIDMDGVMVDTVGGAFEHVQRHHGFVLAREDVRDYWFTGLPQAEILAAMRSKDFYRHLKVMKGMVDAVNNLREEYDGNVRVCSSPMKGAEFCEGEKRDWLAEHFDDDFAREAIITPDKTLVEGRVLIEDNPDIKKGMWRIVMFDQTYNQESQYPRMYGWHDLQPIHDNMRPTA